MIADKDLVLSSLKLAEKWLEDHNYEGYDPADGLTSYLRPLTCGSILLSRLLLQMVWRSPLNLRPVLGVHALRSFIGCGYLARAFLIMFKITGEELYRKKAISCLDWLMDHKAPGHAHYSWGKMFDFASRGGWQRKFEPITVWTSLIGQAFIDAYETIGDKRFLAVAKSVCDWILEVPRTCTSRGCCIHYTPNREGNETIHNQSMLAAAMLARTSKYSHHEKYLQVAREAVEYTCSRQLPDGSWYYGEDLKYRWIDNFHTGYVLDALKTYNDVTGDTDFRNNLNHGFSFFTGQFIEDNGRPRYYHDRAYPIDSQCAAQTIDTLALFSDHEETALELAMRVARWTIVHMQDRNGQFYFMRYPLWVIKAPMIHWAQAVTYKALCHLLTKILMRDTQQVRVLN